MKREVRTEFTARDDGYGAVVAKLSNAFEGGVKKLGQFNHRFSEFRRETGMTTLATLGLGVGIGAWVEKAKEANAEFGRTQKGIAAILSGTLAFGKGVGELERYNRSLELSKGITDDLDETAARFTMNLDDVATTYKTVTASVSSLGLSQKNVMDLTQESIATAKRFGVSGEEAARTIARALQTGAVKGYDEFSISLRKTLGDMKKLTQAQRFDHIQKALKGSMDIADAMSSGIGGAIARIQNTVEDLLRDVTGPLFKDVANTLHGWAKALKETKEHGHSMTQEIGQKLVAGFKTLQSISGFIKDHWISIAAVFTAIKAKELAGSLAGSLKGLGASMGGGVGDAAAGFGGALGKMAGKILPVVGALATFQLAIEGITDFINKKIEKSMDREVRAHAVAGTLGIVNKLQGLGVLTENQDKIARRQMDELRKGGIVGAGGGIDQAGLAEAIANMTHTKKMELSKQLDLSWDFVAKETDDAAKEIAGKLGAFVNRFSMPVKEAADDKSLRFAKQVVNFNGDIHIAQKFEDQDPDRVFVRFKQDLLREAGSRTQALTAEPQGD